MALATSVRGLRCAPRMKDLLCAIILPAACSLDACGAFSLCKPHKADNASRAAQQAFHCLHFWWECSAVDSRQLLSFGPA